MFNKHLSSNQILCIFFVVILTTINCCRNQPHKGLDSEPTCKRIKTGLDKNENLKPLVGIAYE